MIRSFSSLVTKNVFVNFVGSSVGKGPISLTKLVLQHIQIVGEIKNYF